MFQLRQLEEQRRANAGDGDGGPAAHHQHSKSLPAAALQHVQAKGSLMDRLNLLESRIRQLSCELDVAAAAGGSSVPAVARPAEDRAWSDRRCRSRANTRRRFAPPPRPAAELERRAFPVQGRAAASSHQTEHIHGDMIITD